MQNIKGAIFDLDGTLIDSMWMWGEVAVKYIKSHGATPRPGFLEVLRSYNTTEEAQYYIDEYGIDLPLEEVIKGRDNMMFEFLSNDVELKEGVIPLLEVFQERGIKMCIATATDKWLVEPSVKLHGLMKYFECVFTCTEENTSKKYPDIFIKAAKFLGTDINKTIVVEDALYAMKTAKKAGFIVAGVYDKAADNEQNEVKAVCDYYCKNPVDLLSYY